MSVAAGYSMPVSAGSPDAIRCRLSVRHLVGYCRFVRRRVLVHCLAGCHRMPVRSPPSPCRLPDAGCRHHRSSFGWPKPLQVARPPPLLVHVTLNSLCSTHGQKDNNFCSTLYIVRALFVLSMWDISQFSLFLSQLPTHIS